MTAFYRSPTHDEALARLHYLAEHRRHMGLLLGPAGSGKSVTMQVFADELAGLPFHVALLNPSDLTPHEALFQIAVELGTQADAQEPELCWWRRIEDRLASHRYQQLGTVLLWDDMHRATPEITALMLRLLRLGKKHRSNLMFVLAAQTERLRSFDPYLFELCDLRIELLPWEESDLTGYLQFVRRSQGGVSWPTFSQAALMRLNELSRGCPRQVQHLVKLSLLAAQAERVAQVDSPILENVFCELSLAAEGVAPY